MAETNKMAAHKIIFISQEISPYLSNSEISKWGRSLPQSIQQRKYEVRTFMPDFGEINERRNQLHEVIRLSGMNISIGDNDHPLVVKVASMQPSRIQVYFIDNDDYFQKLDSDSDAFGTNREDNDERMIFFARGTVETARKLRWEPDIMQISGWMPALVPLYVRKLFADGPAFLKTKLVYTVMSGENRPEKIDAAVFDKLKEEGVDEAEIEELRQLPADRQFFDRIAMKYADAIVFQGENPDPELKEYAESLGKPVECRTGAGDFAEEYDSLYKTLMEKQ